MLTAIIHLQSSEKNNIVIENVRKLSTNKDIEVIIIDSRKNKKNNFKIEDFILSDNETVETFNNVKIFNVDKKDEINCLYEQIKNAEEKVFFVNLKNIISCFSVNNLLKVQLNSFNNLYKNPILANNGDIFWSKENLLEVINYFIDNNIDLTNCIMLETIFIYCSCVILTQKWLPISLNGVYIENKPFNKFCNLETIYSTDSIKYTIKTLSNKKFKDLVTILKTSYENKLVRLPFEHDYKYDIAITMPIYKIKKDRILSYITEIKNLFKDCCYQIILSDNRPVDSRDCELSEFDDDIVSHVDNEKNIYAFGARKSAFEISDAYYIWSIDDDNEIFDNCNDGVKYFILNAKKDIFYVGETRACGTSWLLSDGLKNVYKKINEENIRFPSYYEEDSITERYQEIFYKYNFISTSNFYSYGTEGYIKGKKINVEKFCETLKVFYQLYFDTEFFYETIHGLMEFFKFELEDYLYISDFLTSEFDDKEIIKNIISKTNSKELSIISEAIDKGII